MKLIGTGRECSVVPIVTKLPSLEAWTCDIRCAKRILGQERFTCSLDLRRLILDYTAPRPVESALDATGCLDPRLQQGGSDEA